jgi:hypothetical protein
MPFSAALEAAPWNVPPVSRAICWSGRRVASAPPMTIGYTSALAFFAAVID